MNLVLSPEQSPDDTVPASIQQEPTSSVLVTIVTVDGIVVRLAERPDGSLAIVPSGNRAPIIIDRFQRGAMMAALAEGA